MLNIMQHFLLLRAEANPCMDPGLQMETVWVSHDLLRTTMYVGISVLWQLQLVPIQF